MLHAALGATGTRPSRSATRAMAVIERERMGPAHPDGQVLVVSHGGPLRLLLVTARRSSPAGLATARCSGSSSEPRRQGPAVRPQSGPAPRYRTTWVYADERTAPLTAELSLCASATKNRICPWGRFMTVADVVADRPLTLPFT